MAGADEARRRVRAMESYARRSIEEDHAAHKDVAAASSDRPAQRPESSFASTPNTGERPTWAPDR
jgi:hypothetical protein